MKMDAAIEQIRILDLDFSRECNEGKELLDNAMRMIKEKFSLKDREECDRILKGTRVYILGKITSEKDTV